MSTHRTKEQNSNPLQAKIVVLGDPRTGKSSLIQSLDPQCRRVSEQNSPLAAERGTTSFTVVEIPSEDLEHAVSSVFLKFWEFKGIGQQEENIAFPGALFCIITLDMRAPESANSAFNKWVAIKEANMPEAFLFVVGTFLDDAAQRRVEVADVCKACAQKEAIYVEVSNLDGSNILLLKRLLCQRLNHMLHIRDELKRPSKASHRGTIEDDQFSAEEGKQNAMNEALLDSNIISPNILDQNILCNSVGNILSSALSVEKWHGFENEQEHLTQVGNKISSFINELSEGIQDAPSLKPSHVNTLAGGTLNTALTEPDAEEVCHLFEIMGLNLPSSLQYTQSSEYTPPPQVSVRVKVRLPDDNFAYLVLKSDDDLEEAVQSFASAHGMPTNGPAISKLIEVGSSMLHRAIKEQEDNDMSKKKSSKRMGRKALKCKARIQLPDNQIITTTISEGEDAVSVSRRIAADYGLSTGYQHKIWEQLQAALLSLEKTPKTSTL